MFKGLNLNKAEVSVRFKGLDLNLLVAFDVLITTRSITRSAEQLHLSQPAVSAALGRLREFFGDELLVRDGRNFHATVVALTLLPLVRQCLREADALVAAVETFVPATSDRIFRIVASDYSATTVLARVAQTLSQEAPNLRLEIVPPANDRASPFQDRSVDLMICPEAYAIRDHPSEPLYEDGFVFAGWDENPIFERPLTMSDIVNAHHVVLLFGNDRVLAYGDQQLASRGIERKIDVTTNSFSSAPWFLPGTMRLLLMHERLADFFQKIAPIRYAAPPMFIDPLRMNLQHNRANKEDIGLSWLRQRIHAAVADAA